MCDYITTIYLSMSSQYLNFFHFVMRFFALWGGGAGRRLLCKIYAFLYIPHSEAFGPKVLVESPILCDLCVEIVKCIFLINVKIVHL